MSTTKRVHRELYIASGLKNGFYTLRSSASGDGVCVDNYIRNLSTDSDKAERLAREYYDRVYGPDCTDVVFLGYADFDLNAWGTCLDPRERAQLASIERGYWPFGRFQGYRIEDADDGYIAYWAKQEGGDRIKAALVELCRSIADERGLVDLAAERKRKLAEQRAQDAVTSQHLGTVGQRLDWSLTVRAYLKFEGTYGWTHVYIMADDAGNVVVGKFSTKLAGVAAGDRVAMKATVKAHGEREGVKQTIINRPKLAA